MTFRLLTVVGARPQFVKAAMVSRAIAAHNAVNADGQIVEEIIHTGQHYDENMSEIFFRQMGIPKPAANLNVGSGSHGAMTARMLEGLEREMQARKPDWVLVYGDTNSTLAAALAAAKLHIPVAHVEAGLRSFNRRMPEEVNRVLTDHVSALLFCPTTAAVENLKREGIVDGVHHVGDVMYDAALVFGEIAERQSTALRDWGLSSKGYFLATVHRAENTDDPERLKGIWSAFERIGTSEAPLVFPVHPRTRAKLTALSLCGSEALPLCHSGAGGDARGPLTSAVQLLPPLSYLDMVLLEKHAKAILTDSGGVQKEAYFHGVPCVTLRDETEWVETVSAGWNGLAGAEMEAIVRAVMSAVPGKPIGEYGTGRTAEAVVARLAGERREAANERGR
jgi:UDP-GlcNAc3NAcA epimerase